jgi:tetratricopeptide (TPR) repeat protein
MSGSDPELQLPITLSLDDHAGPATRISQERLESMVATALVEYDKLQPTNAGKTSVSSLASKPSPWMVAAGSALAIVGSMAAARYFFTEPGPAPAPTTQEPTLVTPQPTAAEIAPEISDSDEVDDVEAADDSTPGARLQEKRRALVRGATAPEDLLQKANQLRAAGRFRDAEQTYSLVYDRFPRSQAAYVARVAAASLELEHLSNPLKARKLFELALQERPKGALDLEARQGLSVALRDLEDRAAEREALRSLVTRHPGSPAARRAQVRLMELGGE